MDDPAEHLCPPTWRSHCRARGRAQLAGGRNLVTSRICPHPATPPPLHAHHPSGPWATALWPQGEHSISVAQSHALTAPLTRSVNIWGAFCVSTFLARCSEALPGAPGWKGRADKQQRPTCLKSRGGGYEQPPRGTEVGAEKDWLCGTPCSQLQLEAKGLVTWRGLGHQGSKTGLVAKI